MNLPKIYWRIAIPFLVVTLALAFGLFLVLTRTSCLRNPECVLRSVFLTTGLALATVLLVSWIIARRTTRPIRELTEVAQRLAAGDDTARVLLHRRDEIGGLIRAFNAMTERQRERYNDLAQANVQSSAVLEHMADGVIITDEAGMVTLINPAARALLNMTEMYALGMSFAALVRHHTLIELWQRCRKQRTGCGPAHRPQHTPHCPTRSPVRFPSAQAASRSALRKATLSATSGGSSAIQPRENLACSTT